jgi:hypothetical protein
VAVIISVKLKNIKNIALFIYYQFNYSFIKFVYKIINFLAKYKKILFIWKVAKNYNIFSGAFSLILN